MQRREGRWQKQQRREHVHEGSHERLHDEAMASLGEVEGTEVSFPQHRGGKGETGQMCVNLFFLSFPFFCNVMASSGQLKAIPGVGDGPLVHGWCPSLRRFPRDSQCSSWTRPDQTRSVLSVSDRE